MFDGCFSYRTERDRSICVSTWTAGLWSPNGNTPDLCTVFPWEISQWCRDFDKEPRLPEPRGPPRLSLHSDLSSRDQFLPNIFHSACQQEGLPSPHTALSLNLLFFIKKNTLACYYHRFWQYNKSNCSFYFMFENILFHTQVSPVNLIWTHMTFWFKSNLLWRKWGRFLPSKLLLDDDITW